MDDKKYDTIIVGGGIAGLTAAAFLAKAGQAVTLFEKQDKVGGLIQTFGRNGVYFDGGLRSMENSGILFPMLRALGIEIDFVKSKTSIGIADLVMVIENEESIDDYQAFLIKEFPNDAEDIKKIIREIRVHEKPGDQPEQYRPHGASGELPLTGKSRPLPQQGEEQKIGAGDVGERVDAGNEK